MNSEDTELKPKWRLLNEGESLEQFDEFYDEDDCCWCLFPSNPEGCILAGDDSMYRRRMTPAEENAEELLDSLRDIRKWIDLSKPPFVSHPAYQSSEAKHISAIAKAEGKNAPQP